MDMYPNGWDRYNVEPPPPEPGRNKFIAILLALIFPVVYLVVQVIVTVIVTFAQSISALMQTGAEGDVDAVAGQVLNSVSDMMPTIIVLYCIFTIAAALLTIKLRRQSVMQEMNVGKPDGIALLFALILGVVLNLATNFIMELIPIPESMIESYNESVGGVLFGGDPVMMFISVGLLVPITEEVCFRAMPMRALKRAFPAWACVIITAIVFAVIHMEPLQILYVLPTGLILGGVFVWCGLGASMAAHIGYNGFSVLALALAGASEIADSEAAALTGDERAALIPMAVITTVIVIALLAGLRWRKGKHLGPQW